MKGLVIKDLYNIVKYGKTVLIVIAFYAVLAIPTGSVGVLAGVCALLFSILVISTFSYDNASKWDQFALSCPITRRGMVRSKYVVGGVMALAGLVVSAVLMAIGYLLQPEIGLAENLAAFYSMWLLGIAGSSVLIPITYKFGVEKSNLLRFAVFLIPTVLIVFAGKTGILTEERLMLAFRFLPVVVVAVVAASYFASCRIYEKQDL